MKLKIKSLKWLIIGGAGLVVAVVCFLLWGRLAGVAPTPPLRSPATWVPRPALEGALRPTLWLNNRGLRAGALFDGRLVLAGEMGLLVQEAGRPGFRRLTAADGLPCGRVECLAPLDGRLILGLGLGGLARWDGRTIEHLLLPPLQDDTVSALSPRGGDALLAATRKGALLELRPGDTRFVPTPGIPKASFSCVLSADRAILVGTYQHGLYLGDERRFRPILVAQRPFRMVTGLCALGNGEYLAGTDSGLYHFNSRGDALGVFFLDRIVEHVNVVDGLIVCACKEDAVYAASLAEFVGGRRVFRGVRAPGFVTGSFPTGDRPVVLTTAGAFRLTDARGLGLAPIDTPEGELAFSSVVSLAAGNAGTLFLGYFHGGVEERSKDGAVRNPLAGPEIHHANCLRADGATLWIGTPQGLFRRSPNGIGPVGEKESPLLRASINDVVSLGNGIVAICHAEGLTFLAGKDEYLISARQGLPSNRILCAAGSESRLLVGTQSGLAVLGAEKVDRVFQTDTAPLRVNWITALLNTPAGTVIGTYGGGVQLFTPEGRWEEFAGSNPRAYVNPGALCLSDDRVLVGTLNEGLVALDLKTKKLCKNRAVLPSRNVQAVLRLGSALYVATDGGVALFPDCKAIFGVE